MAESPLIKKMAYVSIDILIDGSPLQDSYSLLSVETSCAVNAIPQAKFTILLPLAGAENEAFEISEEDSFAPGKKVTIKAGYESKTDVIFEGIIIRHGLKARGGERTQLILHCQDEAVKMTVGRKVKPYLKQKDSDIISAIIGEHPLDKDVEATDYEYEQLMQTGTTDWDFMVTRAEANGMIAYASQGKVYVKKPLSSGSAALELSYDRDVFEFEAELDAGYQLPSVKASGWDFKTGKFVEATSTEPAVNEQGDPTGKKMVAVIGAKGSTVQFTGPMEEGELKGIADSLLLRSRLSAMRGRVVFYGNAKPELNTLIDLLGFGSRFNGSALITSIRHTIFEGEWRTETGFGLSPDFYYEKHPTATGGSRSLPAVNGLQNATVKKIDEDPDGEHRIQVTLPVLGTDVWARQAGLYASKGKGSFFLPEVGDEVIVGFLNDDPRYAIILGSAYSSKNAPPYTADDKNTFKAIVSKNDLKIEINDEDKVMTITTPSQNTIVLSDKDKSIKITDQNGNSVAMESGGITLKSGKDITIDAGGKLTLKAAQEISATSSGGDVKLKGLNVSGEGQVGAKIKGGASAELSAGGNTTVKGAMVMIN